MRDAAKASRRAALTERAPTERDLAEVTRKLDRAQTMGLDDAIDTTELKSRARPCGFVVTGWRSG